MPFPRILPVLFFLFALAPGGVAAAQFPPADDHDVTAAFARLGRTDILPPAEARRRDTQPRRPAQAAQRAGLARPQAPAQAAPSPAPRSGEAGADLRYAEKLLTRESLLRLTRKVKSGGGEQRVMKVVYQRMSPSGPHLFFIDTVAFVYHFDFVTSVLGYPGSAEIFNRNYEGSGESREYNLASLVLSEHSGRDGNDQLLLELWSGDTLSAEYLTELYQQIKRRIPAGMELIFHPLSVDQERLAASGALSFPSITTDALYRNRNYLPLNEGVAYGYLKFVDPADPDPLLGLTDIAVFDHVPNDIGLVGGVVTEEFQTPLSHVNVKSMNRGTVNMALRDAKAKLAPYLGKPVELVASANQYTINELPEERAQHLIAGFWSKKKPHLGSRPQFILDPRNEHRLVNLAGHYRALPDPRAHQRLIRTVGAKAANLAVLDWVVRENPDIPGVTSPPTVGVPFNFYDQFLSLAQAGIDPDRRDRVVSPGELIREILNRDRLLDPGIAHPVEKVRPALESIRAILMGSHVPDHLIALFRQYLFEDESSPLYYRHEPILLLRSSTNSEDLDGFTGAGLYNSIAVKLYDAQPDGRLVVRSWNAIEKDLRHAIPYVYSSVWNERAYLEREWFSIDGDQHLDVKAAIAVHGGFDGTVPQGKVRELANGVAITANIFSPEEPEKLYINGQHYGLSVTNPPSPEELERIGESSREPYRTEELLVTTYLSNWDENAKPDAWLHWPFERLQRSSIRRGESIFQSDDEARRLSAILKQIKLAMASIYQKNPETFAADVEWNIFGRDRWLSINQVRPFKPAK